MFNFIIIKVSFKYHLNQIWGRVKVWFILRQIALSCSSLSPNLKFQLNLWLSALPSRPTGAQGSCFPDWGGSPVPIALLGKGWAPRAPGHPAPTEALCLGPAHEVGLFGGPTSAAALCLSSLWQLPQTGILHWWPSVTPVGIALSGALWGLFYKSTSPFLRALRLWPNHLLGAWFWIPAWFFDNWP